jgi:hypothetical protein
MMKTLVIDRRIRLQISHYLHYEKRGKSGRHLQVVTVTWAKILGGLSMLP